MSQEGGGHGPFWGEGGGGRERGEGCGEGAIATGTIEK